MATGPEHYQEAERLIKWVTNHDGDIHNGKDTAACLAAAQVHATLAQAAAVAMAGRAVGGQPVGVANVDFDAWDTAAGERED